MLSHPQLSKHSARPALGGFHPSMQSVGSGRVVRWVGGWVGWLAGWWVYGIVSRVVAAVGQVSLCGRVFYSLGNTVDVDGHSARQTHHVGFTEGVVAQVASLLVRHQDGLLPLL